MPLSSAFYTPTPAQQPAMFQQLSQDAANLNQPPPVPDLFRRPITPAVAQAPDAPPVNRTTGPVNPQPTQGDGGAAGGNASQMAQARLLYQMLLGGGPTGFLNQLMPGQNGQQQFRGVGQAGGAFAGLQNPSVTALFDQGSYWKPSMMTGAQRGYDQGQLQQYRGARGAAPTPDVYQNAITFLAQLMGLGG